MWKIVPSETKQAESIWIYEQNQALESNHGVEISMVWLQSLIVVNQTNSSYRIWNRNIHQVGFK